MPRRDGCRRRGTREEEDDGGDGERRARRVDASRGVGAGDERGTRPRGADDETSDGARERAVRGRDVRESGDGDGGRGEGDVREGTRGGAARMRGGVVGEERGGKAGR